jgi:hypothetical protein
MHVVHCEGAIWETVETTGTRFKSLNDPELGSRYGFEATLRHYIEEEYNVKAHRHKIEQVRYVLTGDAGPTNGMSSPPGSVNYIGASTFYGPYDRPDNVEYFSLKFGGTEDPKIPFPKPRFTTPVVLQPENFDWTNLNSRGQLRELATFGEAGTQIFELWLESGASHDLYDERPTVLFVLSGYCTIGSDKVEKHDTITVEAEERLTVSGAPSGRLFGVHLSEVRQPSSVG